MRKIILLGYMASGKTTVGKILAEKMNIPAYDLDEIIEEKEQKTIPEIFSTKGEIYFRKLEHLIFKSQLQLSDDFILSLGGGTPCYADNHKLLSHEGVTSIYLKASVATLSARLQNKKNGRPLMDSVSEKERADYIAAHLFERSFYYNHATFKLNTEGLTPNDVADAILKLLA